MIDFTKLDGYIEAISAEVAAPSPSHNGLARLVSLALAEIKTVVNAIDTHFAHVETSCSSKTETINGVGVTSDLPAPESKEIVKKRTKKRG